MSVQFKDKHGLKFTDFLRYVTRFHDRLQMNVLTYEVLTAALQRDVTPYHWVSGSPTFERNVVPSSSRVTVLDSSTLEDKATVVLQNVRSHQPCHTASHPRRSESSTDELHFNMYIHLQQMGQGWRLAFFGDQTCQLESWYWYKFYSFFWGGGDTCCICTNTNLNCSYIT